MMQHGMADHPQIAEGTQVRIQQHIFLQITVDGKDHHFLVVIEHRSGIHHRYVIIVLGVEFFTGQLGQQALASAHGTGLHDGIEDGLGPGTALLAGHDGGNDVHQLGQAADLHTVRIFQHGDQHQAHQQRIFEVIDVLQQRQGIPPGLRLVQLLILLIGMIPHVPFIQAQVHLLFRMLLALDGIADGSHGLDEIIQIQGGGQEVFRFVMGIAIIAVQGHIIHIVIAFRQHLVFPFAEGGHAGAGGTAGHGFDGIVGPLHHLGCFVGNAAVFHSGLGAHLPRAVHFIAQAPQFDIEGVFGAVFDAQIAPVAAALVIGIFHHIPGRIGATGAQVHRVHHFGARFLGPGTEFMQAHFVGFGGFPGQVQPMGTFCHRTDGIFPVEAGHKIAAGITHNGHVQGLHQIDHILAEAQLIRRGMTGLINAGVYRTAQVFNEGTVNALVNIGNHIVLVQNQLSVLHKRHSFILFLLLSLYHEIFLFQSFRLFSSILPCPLSIRGTSRWRRSVQRWVRSMFFSSSSDPFCMISS